MDVEAEAPRWHEALAYAVVGRRVPGLGRQAHPDVGALAARLGPLVLEGQPGAYAVPDDLREGLGPAQFTAALGALRAALAAGHPRVRVVAGARALTQDERRLLDDLPPHHRT